MPLQARAEATRQKILDSAVELFDEYGYGETGLADVLQRAGISKGAFYYHFDSKEAVAKAIINEFDNKATAVVNEHFDADAPTLAGLIAITFTVQELMQRDPVTKIGQMLCQALGQVSNAGAQVYRRWTEAFVEMVKALTAVGQIRTDMDPVDVAEAIWVGSLGAHLVSAAVGDDPYRRLARSWRVLLGSIVPDHDLADLLTLLDRTAQSKQVAV